MKFKFRYYLKQYLNFSRKDRNGIIVLSIILIIFITINIVANYLTLNSDSDFTEIKKYFTQTELPQSKQNTEVLSLFHFNPNTITPGELDSLSLPATVKKNLIKYRNSGGKFYSKTDFRKLYGLNDSIFSKIEDYIDLNSDKKVEVDVKTYFPEKRLKKFNPNEVEFDELVSMGFSKFQAKNLIEFRKKKGIFKKNEDLLKIYGIDSTFYLSVKDYINININENVVKEETIREQIKIELNTCSAVDLVKINGIGETLAGRIIKYRELLGGYYSQIQLLEVYGMTNENYNTVKNFVYADIANITKIRLNFYGMSDMPRHPYLKYGQLKSILNYRSIKGPFSDVNIILEAELVDSVTFRRIVPYLTCR